MPQIHISVRDKVARAARRTPSIVCGNADYEIVFDFDSEWEAHDQKIARFIWGGAYFDVPFMGNVCPVPTVVYAAEVEVGVYAEELRTTTPAAIACRRSVRSDESLPLHDKAPAEYENIALDAAATAQRAAAEAKNGAGEAKEAATQAKEAAAQAKEAVSEAEGVMTIAKDTVTSALYAKMDAQSAQKKAQQSATQAATSAEQAEAMVEQVGTMIEQFGAQTADAGAHAAQMNEHVSATHTRYSFTVGQLDELNFMTPESCGIYQEMNRLRYNDKTLFTIYRYPLTDTKRISSALWHAHVMQQALLQVSTDSKTWITLLDSGVRDIDSQDYYELCDIVDLKDAKAIYIKVSDSSPKDGFGGALSGDIPVTLDITHGILVPYALPKVSKQDEGSFLRVIGGRWCAADITTLPSRVHTYTFKVGGPTEAKYLQSNSTGILNESCRFNDRSAFTLYRYHIANAALVRRVTWTATLGQQLYLECSSDGENWTKLFNAGATSLPMERRTFDLTDKVNLLTFDEIYIRILDSNQSDGFGGAIARDTAVNLYVERCEPPIYL